MHDLIAVESSRIFARGPMEGGSRRRKDLGTREQSIEFQTLITETKRRQHPIPPWQVAGYTQVWNSGGSQTKSYLRWVYSDMLHVSHAYARARFLPKAKRLV